MIKKYKTKVTHIRTSHGVFGAERVILGLLKKADTDKFDVSVTLVNSEEGLNDDFLNEIQELGIKAENFLLNGRFDWNGLKKLRQYIISQEFDIIHCHDFKANFYGLSATLGTNVKRVATHHGSTKDSLLLKFYLGINEYFLLRKRSICRFFTRTFKKYNN